ncbi:MAG: transposase [Candidatus Woesearchaeota archaeon]
MSYDAEKKLEIVLAGMKDDTTVNDLCDKYNISRQTYYNWKENLMKSSLSSLESKQAGRKSEDHISSLKEAREKVNQQMNF